MHSDIKHIRCSVDDCVRNVHAKGFCGKHYHRFRVHGDPSIVKCRPRPVDVCNDCGVLSTLSNGALCRSCYLKAFRRGKIGSKIKCRVSGCDELAYHRGAKLCLKHYDRYKTFARFNTLYNEDGNGTVTKDGYLVVYKDGKQVRHHRLVMENHLGRKLSKDELVHHKDGNKLNNQIDNLEVVDIKTHTLLSNIERVFRLPIEEARRLLSLVELQFDYKITLENKEQK